MIHQKKGSWGWRVTQVVKHLPGSQGHEFKPQNQNKQTNKKFIPSSAILLSPFTSQLLVDRTSPMNFIAQQKGLKTV
jgi:hypothetical protein